MIHTYMSATKHKYPALEYFMIPFYKLSCANGWGMGNLAISAENAARWWFEYMGTENIINNSTKNELMNFHLLEPIHYEWVMYAYGGGLMYKKYPL